LNSKKKSQYFPNLTLLIGFLAWIEVKVLKEVPDVTKQERDEQKD